MQLAQSVSRVLDDGATHWTLAAATEPGTVTRVQATLLQDAVGPVLILMPADALLDLEALNRFSGRELLAADEATVAACCAAQGLPSLPALPRVLQLPIIADRSLCSRGELELDAAGVRIRMPAAHFAALLEHETCSSADFCVALSTIDPGGIDASDDDNDIGNAVARFTSRRVERRLEDTLDFPPLPEIAHRIIRISADPYASVSDLARVVEIDPALAAQVVSWASSPYYAAPGKVRSIQDAIVRVLGFDLVMNLALGLALGKTMRMSADGPHGYRTYWVQAVHGAAMAEGLAKAMPSTLRPPLGYMYLSGLLHNFGALILGELFKPQMQLVCRYTDANPHLGHWYVERFLLGVTREQMAARLMRFWHLPEAVCATLRFQHAPEQAGEHETAARVLQVATRLLRQHGIGSAPLEPLPDQAFAALGIDRGAALEVSEYIRSAREQLAAIARDLAA
ncbi:MAG: HDOD domain-containing protein [Pseudomonadales bacterium]|jgi:HD-like signal output (HDOD) protein/prolyl-tRNA editing enzyme YbaK/EbsC (Cys-tRNA(Pro) deacylase)|nr:HDOD domain-containing protein [Pseudomonadales bacterium]MCP5321103.1 HDOD domain-containing protein [Pseudomonadales bacterium]MCP5337291.1 HDOD domain-containing protein [Pseudomonadales bacterium]